MIGKGVFKLILDKYFGEGYIFSNFIRRNDETIKNKILRILGCNPLYIIEVTDEPIQTGDSWNYNFKLTEVIIRIFYIRIKTIKY